MPPTDHTKEEIAYLKLWFGFVVVVFISLAGWIFSSVDKAAWFNIGCAVLGLFGSAIAAVKLDLEFRWRIRQLKE